MRLWPYLRIAIPLGTLAGLLLSFAIQRWTRPVEPPFVVEQPPPTALRPFAPPERRHACAGRVLAGPSGEAVADALVWLRSGDEGSFAWTDAEGRFLFEALGAGPWPTKVVATGFEPLDQTLAEDQGLHTLTLIKSYGPPPTLPALARAPLEGRLDLRAAAGLDASEFEVVLLPANPLEIGAALPRRTRCDARGAFRIDDLFEAQYTLRVLPAWARGGSWPDLLLGVDGASEHSLLHARQPGASPHLLAIALGCIEGTLHETIALGPGGEPIQPRDEAVEGAFVLLEERASAHLWPAQSTDPLGHFAFRTLPPGKYTLTLRAGSARQEQAIELGLDQTRTLDLHLPAAAGAR